MYTIYTIMKPSLINRKKINYLITNNNQQNKQFGPEIKNIYFQTTGGHSVCEEAYSSLFYIITGS